MIKLIENIKEVKNKVFNDLPCGATFRCEKIPYNKKNIYMVLGGDDHSFTCIAGDDVGSLWGRGCLSNGKDEVVVVELEAKIVS